MDTSRCGGGGSAGDDHQQPVDDATHAVDPLHAVESTDIAETTDTAEIVDVVDAVDAADAVEAGDLGEFLGDVQFVLSSFAIAPEDLFDGDAGSSGVFARLLGTVHETIAALEALGARALVALNEQDRAEEKAAARDACAHEPEVLAREEKKATRRADRSTQRCLSMLTRCCPATAGRRLTRSRRLVRSMPGMLSALAEGKVTGEVALSTAGTVGPLTPEQREWVDQQLTQRLPDLDAAGAGQFRREVQALVHAKDPAGAGARHERARRDRSVSMTPGEHGMATVTAHLPAMEATLIRKRLSLEAERLIVEGDKRGHSAIMADLLTTSLLSTSTGGRVTLDVGVIITERSLLCPHTGDVAHLEGYGPVPAHMIRHQLRQTLLGPGAGSSKGAAPGSDSTAGPDPGVSAEPVPESGSSAGSGSNPNDPDPEAMDPYGSDGPAYRAVLRRLFTHPTTGQLVNMESRARAFPPVLAKFIRLRDTACRGPFCDAAIRQIDHITPHSHGGKTTADGGQGGCQFCNDKENQTTSVRRVGTADDGDHTVEWTDRHGTTRTTTPTPLIRPKGRSQNAPINTDEAETLIHRAHKLRDEYRQIITPLLRDMKTPQADNENER